MEASTSRAVVGVVLKAAHMSFSPFRWTFSSGFAWTLVLFHQAGQA